ncbi:MAG: addiction module protein [Verrucomicrobiota bacterium]
MLELIHMRNRRAIISDRDGKNDYCYPMIITYQTVVDENGKPTAVQIPWEQFELIQQKLEEGDIDFAVSAEWSDELNRRASDIDEGRVELVEGEDFLSRLRAV